MTAPVKKLRLATAWLGGCSGCHMSLLDLGERLVELAGAIELVYGPLVDAKEFPAWVDVALIEGAVANIDNLELIQQIRERSRIVVSLGDCAVTGNVTSLRNFFTVDDLLTAVYHAGPGSAPHGAEAVRELPALLPRVLPLHQVVPVDVFLPGCPPDPERIWTALSALLRGEPVHLSAEQRTFG
jgi:NAD-reducing hydrogenase small subunit